MKRTYKDSVLFHKQVRIGKGRRAIRITKIRTMPKGLYKGDATSEINSAGYAARIMRFLRKNHLDELPQIISWLKGELLLVGPRPLQRHLYQNLSPELKKIYNEIGPGLLPVEYACKTFPPSEEEILETAKEFYTLWKKNKNIAYRVFAKRILRNYFGKEMPREALRKPKQKD